MGDTTGSFRDTLRSLTEQASQNPAYAFGGYVDLVAQMLDKHILARGLASDSGALRRASFSQKSRILKRGTDSRLLELTNAFRNLKNSTQTLLPSQDSLNSLREAVAAIMEHTGYADEQARLRIPKTRRTVNSVAVDTAKGYKTFNLLHGDITTVPTDLLVISSDADRDKPPGGMVVRALKMNYGIEIGSEPWLNFGKSEWTCFQGNIEGTPFRNILTVRMPGEIGDRDPNVFFDTSIQGICASIAALEQMGHEFGVVSLPVIYGQRIAEYRTSIGCLIRHAAGLLKTSGHTHTVQFVVYTDYELEDWDKAMNESLGRSYIPAGNDAAIKSLCREITALSGAHRSGPLASALQPLLTSIGSGEHLCIENVCVFGRKLAELLVAVLLDRAGCKPADNLMVCIDDLRKSGTVAPWITSYMHSLRIFGNETVHSRDEQIDYYPPRLSHGDLVSVLSAIRALLAFWGEYGSSHM